MAPWCRGRFPRDPRSIPKKSGWHVARKTIRWSTSHSRESYRGEYGAGQVIVWDQGTYTSERDMSEGLRRGHLSFQLDGQKLHGGFALTRLRGGKDETWLLVKKSDDDADGRRKPVRSQPESVVSGRTIDELS